VAAAIATFAALTHLVLGGRSTALDRAILLWMARVRTPSVTMVMVVVTALGSPRPFALLTLAFVAVLIARRDRWGIAHLVVAGLGAWILEYAIKRLLERARPTEVAHLVQVSGYSYPSGHALAGAALYLTMAIIAARHLRRRAPKALLIAAACTLIITIGVSRMYLGVHYPSDVASGIALGTAWALLVSAAVGAMGRPKQVSSS
jgi:undecaprenyl-diphosphatase